MFKNDRPKRHVQRRKRSYVKTLVVAQHGAYHHPDRLNEFGMIQMERLGRKLKETVNGESVTVVTSTAGRVQESAEILGKIFGVKPEMESILLWYCTDKLERLLELIRSKKYDPEILILVTSAEFTEKFPHYYGVNELDVHSFPRYEAGQGHAWEIHNKQKECILR